MITLLLRVGCPIMANPNIEFMPVKKKKDSPEEIMG